MEIKNLRTGKMVRFGGEHFKRLIRLQNSTGMKYFTKKDLATCATEYKKPKTPTTVKNKKGLV